MNCNYIPGNIASGGFTWWTISFPKATRGWVGEEVECGRVNWERKK